MDKNTDDEVQVVAEPKSARGPLLTRSRVYLLIAVIAAAIVSGCLIWYMRSQSEHDNTSTDNKTSTVPAKKPIDKPQNDELLAKFLKPTTGETWYDERKPIAAQGWLKDEDINRYLNDYDASREKAEAALKENTPTYYEVGTHGENKIILAVTVPALGGQAPHLFEKKPDGTVAYIVRPQTTDPEPTVEEKQWVSELLTDKVSARDTTTHYDSLSVPNYFVLDNGEKVTQTEWGGLGSEDSMTSSNGATKIKVTDYGRNKLYRVETKYADTQLTNIGYYLETVLGMTVSLDYTPNTPNLEKYTWSNNQPAKGPDYNGKVVFDDIKAIARGCGGATAAVTRTDALKDVDLVAVGKTDAGRTVYQPKNNDHALFKKAYDEYVQWQKTTEQKTVSFDEYKSAHGLVIIKNASDEALVYVRSQYAPSYGCAKPVVYLYPTVTTSVDVRVGADVKISDPYYPNGGWRNVVAEPSGKLTYRGASYDSLFWEGPGYGQYPGIVAGTVVKRADAESTMRRQLAEQGLNAKETADFMEFWTEKIPNKPYIRLTWLNTSQMNSLAPLYVTPRPDTVIRVFLDMDGYDTRIRLPQQKLSKIPRKGFTVVEWGGLTTMMR